jgi:hypothetical protein
MNVKNFFFKETFKMNHQVIKKEKNFKKVIWNNNKNTHWTIYIHYIHTITKKIYQHF